eukprot:SAG11_NODE_507_length_8879_cov_8.961048_6_plen_135_part_00
MGNDGLDHSREAPELADEVWAAGGKTVGEAEADDGSDLEGGDEGEGEGEEQWEDDRAEQHYDEATADEAEAGLEASAAAEDEENLDLAPSGYSGYETQDGTETVDTAEYTEAAEEAVVGVGPSSAAAGGEETDL